MKFETGIFGCVQNEKKEISLEIGWLVKPSTSNMECSSDRQFKRDYLGTCSDDDSKGDIGDDELNEILKIKRRKL